MKSDPGGTLKNFLSSRPTPPYPHQHDFMYVNPREVHEAYTHESIKRLAMEEHCSAGGRCEGHHADVMSAKSAGVIGYVQVKCTKCRTWVPLLVHLLDFIERA